MSLRVGWCGVQNVIMNVGTQTKNDKSMNAFSLEPESPQKIQQLVPRNSQDFAIIIRSWK